MSVSLACAQCGREILRKPSQVRRAAASYCSLACQAAGVDKRKPLRACNRWLQEQIRNDPGLLHVEAVGKRPPRRKVWALYHEWKQRNESETGFPLASPYRSFMEAVKNCGRRVQEEQSRD